MIYQISIIHILHILYTFVYSAYFIYVLYFEPPHSWHHLGRFSNRTRGPLAHTAPFCDLTGLQHAWTDHALLVRFWHERLNFALFEVLIWFDFMQNLTTPLANIETNHIIQNIRYENTNYTEYTKCTKYELWKFDNLF